MQNVLDRLKLDVVQCGDFAGNRPYEKADVVGARVLLFNPDDDPLVDKTLVAEAIDDHGYIAGLRFNCAIGEDPVTFARSRSATIDTLGGKSRISVVMFDVELSKSRPEIERLAWQAKFLDEWDRIRYGRPTLYNVAAFQDRTQNDYARMLRRNAETGTRIRKVTVQGYVDRPATMTPVKPLRAVVDYLAARDVQLTDLEPCVDVAHALEALGGYDAGTIGATIFQAGRIP